MHEYSIVQALVDRVEEEARARNAVAVRHLTVRIGELSGVEVELLRTAYLTFREKTMCEQAEIEITYVPAAWACRACGTDIPRGESLQCAACGGAAALKSGDEILLERIELEVA